MKNRNSRVQPRPPHTVHGITDGVTRPCFLIIDREYPSSISTRKLVVESAKFNVITAYSPGEAVETLRRFSAVDGVVMDAETEGISCEALIELLRTVRQDVPIVTIAPGGNLRCEGAQYSVDSHDPKHLIETLQRLCPAGTEEVSQQDKGLRIVEDRETRGGKQQKDRS
jgi:CheY-like chemotaxis protein